MAVTATLLPTRDHHYEVWADKYLKETHSPETLRGVVKSKPPPGAIPELVLEISLRREKRVNGDLAPCPICSPNSPQYLHGFLAWFGDEGVYRCIGNECIARLCGVDKAHKVRLNFEYNKQLKADYEFAFDNVNVAPAMKAYLEALLPVAEYVDKLRLSVGRSQVKGALWKTLKEFDGQLAVWEVKHVERLDTRSNTMQDKTERTVYRFGIVKGKAALESNVSLARGVRTHLGRLSIFCIPDAEQMILNAHEDHQSLSGFRRVLYESQRLKITTEGKIRDVLAFFDEDNFRRIHRFGNDPRSPCSVYATARNGTFKIGPTMAGAVIIRPDFTILEGLPAWPMLP